MRFLLIMLLIVGLLVVAGCSSLDEDERPFPERDGGFRMNFTLDNKSINEVTDFFGSAQNREEVSEYCTEHRMECGYYCRWINPDNELCSFMPGRNGTMPRFRDNMEVE